MILSKYQKTYDRAMRENSMNRFAIVICLLIIVILLCLILGKKTIVTLTPYTLSQDAWITSREGSQSYKEAWALFFAEQLGNITPDSIDFVSKRVGPLLSPSIYHNFMETINTQANHIKEDRITLRFVPRSVIFEPDSNKTFVSGNLYTRSVSGKEIHEFRTYEFEIGISSYTPILISMDTYNGQPKTLKQIQLDESRRKSKEERARAR